MRTATRSGRTASAAQTWGSIGRTRAPKGGGSASPSCARCAPCASAGLEFVDAGEALVFRRWLGGRAAAVLANPTDRDLAVAADLAARSPSVLLSDGAAIDCGGAGRVQATLKAHGYAVLAL